MTADAVLTLLPEIMLAAGGVLLYLCGAFWPARRGWSLPAGVAIVAAALALGRQSASDSPAGPLAFDQFALMTRWLALIFGMLLVLAASARRAAPEYLGSLLMTVAGAMLAASADDLILLFTALELVSIPTYVLLYLGRRDALCREAAAKYFFLGVFASAILLYGFSFLYGAGGSTDLSAIQAALSAGQLPQGFSGILKAGLGLTLAGLCFKVAAVPLHFYAPDVYQGTTPLNAALLSIVPKMAGLAAMTRIFTACAPIAFSYSWTMLLAVALATMTLGNILGLWQNNLRRLMAYSSVAQTGYMLLALAAALADAGSAANDSLAYLWFYFTVYALATLGVFVAIEHLGGENRELQGIDDLAGLARRKPGLAATMAACLFSLAGIPLLAGFWGKLLVFVAALSVGGEVGWWMTAAVVIAALNAAVAAVYYLRIVSAMYFRTSPADVNVRGGAGPWLAAASSAALVVALGLYPGPFLLQSRCATELLNPPEAAAPREQNEKPSESAVPREQNKKPPPQPAPQSGATATTTFIEDKCRVPLLSESFTFPPAAAIIAGGGDNKLSRHP